MKKIHLLFTVFLLAIVLLAARRIEPLNLTVKKGLSVGTGTNNQVDSAAWVEIGVDSSTRASILFHKTDTSLLDTNHVQAYVLLVQESDSAIYFRSGTIWRRLAFADELPE